MICKASGEVRPARILMTTLESSCTAVSPPIAVSQDAMESVHLYRQNEIILSPEKNGSGLGLFTQMLMFFNGWREKSYFVPNSAEFRCDFAQF